MLAEWYDDLYAHKPYAREAKIYWTTLGEPNRLIEIGCGTGGHGFYFNQWCRHTGYDPCGAMAARACAKGINVLTQSMFEKVPPGQFDAACAPFSVLSYAAADKGWAVPIEQLALHVRSGGRIAFDVPNRWSWSGDFKSVQVIIPKKNVTIERRMAKGVTEHGIVEVMDNLLLTTGGSSKIQHHIKHRLRPYDPDRIVEVVEGCGLNVIYLCPLDDPGAAVNSHTPHIFCVAEKR